MTVSLVVESKGAEMNVLITGAAGLIGGVLWAGLRRTHRLYGIDVSAGPGKDVLQADMARLEMVERAFVGQDVVVDLAARPGKGLPWQDVYANNLLAAHNALEAARRAGVRRVIFASTNYVSAGYETAEPYATIVLGRHGKVQPGTYTLLTPDLPPRPDCPYAVGKACGEVECRYYSELHGLSTIVLRIGTVNAEDRPLKPRHYSVWLSHRDLVHLVDCCIAAPEWVRFAAFYGVSANTWRIWDTTEAHATVGYTPCDNAEAWRGLESSHDG